MKLINLTPHPVQIFGHDNRTTILPACHAPARLNEEAKMLGYMDVDDLELRISEVQYTYTYNLPERIEKTFYVVSQMVAQANPDRDDLLFPYDIIRNEDGTIFAAKTLARWKDSNAKQSTV